jgi:predicted dehydrogenase
MSSSFRVVVVGLGIQGNKRVRIAGDDVVFTVDPTVRANFSQLSDVPLETYDAALLCVPDQPKYELLSYLLSNGKHALVEKPLFSAQEGDIERLARLADARNVVCYTAYNHRFEPHIARLKDHIQRNTLGKIYRVRIFYGNGTARDVRNSVWRDQGGGVLPDLGSHLLDTLLFLFGGWPDLKVWSAQCFENKCFDHVILGGPPQGSVPQVELELSLLSWRNHFVMDVYGENGSAHIESLCKWGPSTFTLRTRVLPSGRPPEEAITLVQSDPTWELEYAHFKQSCLSGNLDRSLARDICINNALKQLADTASTCTVKV